MKLKKTYLFLPIITLPFLSVISCSNNSNNSTNVNEKSKETKAFENYLKNNGKTFEGKSIKNENIKNIFSISNFSSDIEDFKNKLSKYFNMDNEFENFLVKDNNLVLKAIKKINIQPIYGTKDVNVIFYLNSTVNDVNVVSTKIANVLIDNFSYSKEYEFTLVAKDKINYISGKDALKIFDQELKNLREKKDLTIVKRAFGITNEDEFKNDLNSFTFKRESNALVIQLNQVAINEGKIIKKNNDVQNPYWISIKSFNIVKN